MKPACLRLILKNKQELFNFQPAALVAQHHQVAVN